MLRRTLCALAALAVVSCASSSSSSGPPASANNPLRGQLISLVLPGDSGGMENVAEGGGKATVVDFWAPSCEPCAKSLPALIAKQDDIEAKGGRLLLVAVLSEYETNDQAAEKLRSWGVEASFLVDRDGLSKTQAGVLELPATLVLDKRGTLVWVAPKGASPSDIVAAIPQD